MTQHDHDPNCNYCTTNAERKSLNSLTPVALLIYIGGGLLLVWLGNLLF